MTTPRLRAGSPPGQDEDRLLGEYSPTQNVRLTLRAWGPEAILWRHRSPGNSGPATDPAAHVTHSGGTVTDIEWDDWHLRHQPVWRHSVEDWIRATIKAAS